MEYFNEYIKYDHLKFGYPDISGPDIHRVAKWLSKDIILKNKLIERLDGSLKKSIFDDPIDFWNKLLMDIM